MICRANLVLLDRTRQITVYRKKQKKVQFVYAVGRESLPIRSIFSCQIIELSTMVAEYFYFVGTSYISTIGSDPMDGPHFFQPLKLVKIYRNHMGISQEPVYFHIK